MSTNVYGPQDGPAPDFLRNTYDKQFQNLISTNFGELRPCFCKEVLPGDSVNIDPVVAIRSQPIVFPIQTRMKFYCHFFYGRNRILFKDWEDFIFKTKDGIIPPLLRLTPSRAKKMISTGSLGDNLGVPSTFGDSEQVSTSEFVFNSLYTMRLLPTLDKDNVFVNRFFTNPDYSLFNLAPLTSITNEYTNISLGFFVLSNVKDVPLSGNSLVFATPPRSSASASYNTGTFSILVDNKFVKSSTTSISLANNTISWIVPDDIVEFTKNLNSPYQILLGSIYIVSQGDNVSSTIAIEGSDGYFNFIPTSSMRSTISSVSNPVSIPVNSIYDSTDDLFINTNKFVGNSPSIPLSALPFRLYEFICNYYYRNDTNNPYILDGEPQYNRFIPSTDSGWDDNEYLLHHRNWESDMYTTCVPSPQFGTAPLVGLTYNGGLTADVSTNVTDSDGVTRDLKIKVAVDDEGNISDILNADTGVPSGSLKQLMDAMSTTGISINTLRNVNSFQRFLENVIRRGLRYRNQLLSHFGVSVDYPDIDIPQFIGGFSGDLNVREVTNMAETSSVALGDVAGKIDAVIQSNHSINCYCAEHGFIMGIFCIVPVPTYSQVLPNMFTRYDAFDYFQKEFDKTGYVPVTYRNFLPLQADNPDEVFGYQRAWYEYMSSLDEVHGDFRLTLDDFVLYRVFKDKPTLNESFLKVDSDSLNNIFAVDKVEEKYKNSDKFLCQFYFQYSQKTMIPKHGVASLE